MRELVIGGAPLCRPITRPGIRTFPFDSPEGTPIFVPVPAPLLPGESSWIGKGEDPLPVGIPGKLHVAPIEATTRRVEPGLQILIGRVAGRITVVLLQRFEQPFRCFLLPRM